MDTEEIKKRLRKIENDLQTISFDYSRKIVNTFCDDMTLMRDHLIYRNGAIGFHLDLIINQLNYYSDLLQQPKGFEIGSHISFNAGWKMNYLLDDLIFNKMSFYDYFATFIIYVFYGEEIRNEANDYDPLNIKNKKMDHLFNTLQKVSWLEMAKLVKNNPDRRSRLTYYPSAILDTEVSKKIKDWDSKFIYKLYKLRSDIIHNKVSPVGNSPSYSSNEGNKFNFSVHGMFEKIFSESSNELEEAVEFLLKNYSNSVIDCTGALIMDIEENRLVKKEDMFQKWEWEL